MSKDAQDAKDAPIASRRTILKTLAAAGLSGLAHAVMARSWTAPLFAIITLDEDFYIIPTGTEEDLSITVDLGVVEPIYSNAIEVNDSSRLLGLDSTTGELSRESMETTPMPTHRANVVVQFVSKVGGVNTTTSQLRSYPNYQGYGTFSNITAFGPRGFTQNQTGSTWRGSFNITSYFDANSTTVITQLRQPKNTTVWAYSKNVTTTIPWSGTNVVVNS